MDWLRCTLVPLIVPEKRLSMKVYVVFTKVNEFITLLFSKILAKMLNSKNPHRHGYPNYDGNSEFRSCFFRLW